MILVFNKQKPFVHNLDCLNNWASSFSGKLPLHSHDGKRDIIQFKARLLLFLLPSSLTLFLPPLSFFFLPLPHPSISLLTICLPQWSGEERREEERRGTKGVDWRGKKKFAWFTYLRFDEREWRKITQSPYLILVELPYLILVSSLNVAHCTQNDKCHWLLIVLTKSWTWILLVSSDVFLVGHS